MNRINIRIFNQPWDANQFIINQWKEIGDEAVREKGNYTVALSGGKTRVPLFRRLSQDTENTCWRNTHIFMVDERFVPPGHPDSNQRMIRDNLIERTMIPNNHFHPYPIKKSITNSVITYQRQLKHFFQLKAEELPVFDFVLLGIGQDGHTASLFPENQKSYYHFNLVHAVRLSRLHTMRMTLTIPVLNQAKNIFFLVLGKQKSKIIKVLLEQKNKRLPASRIDPVQGKLVMVLDLEAASLLRSP